MTISARRKFRFAAAGLGFICAACLPSPLRAQWVTGSGGAIYYNGGNVGIGTSAPSVNLHVVGKTYSDHGFWVAQGDLTNTVNNSPWYGIGWSNLTLGPNGGAVQVAGWNGLNFQTATGQLVIRGDTGNVGIGIANPANKLSVNGTIGAKEVMVASSGADYVFDRDYRLAPLSEIADFVAENHHLPDIPSAREVEEKGVSLGDMQSKLLAKIEELTLHMIQAGERSDRLERENAELRDRMLRLETGVQPLQASGSAERK